MWTPSTQKTSLLLTKNFNEKQTHNKQNEHNLNAQNNKQKDYTHSIYRNNSLPQKIFNVSKNFLWVLVSRNNPSSFRQPIQNRQSLRRKPIKTNIYLHQILQIL